MQLRHHEAKVGRVDAFRLDPRAIKIEPGHNIRDMTSEENRAHVESLKIQIRADGVKKPLEVRMVGDDIYVTDGECRLTAVMELIQDEGFDCKSVLCIHEPDGTSPIERKLNVGSSNSGKRPSQLEIAELVRQALRLGATEKQIQESQGWASPATVKQYLEKAAMPEAVKQQVRNNDVSATVALKITKDAQKDGQVDPEFAAKLIAANKDENRRLGVGKRAKVTPKTIKRDAKPKPDKLPIPPRAPRAAETEQQEPAGSAPPEPTPSETATASVAQPTPAIKPNGQAARDLMEALAPFAGLANDHDLTALEDSDILEVFVRDVRRAALVYTSAAGREE